MSDTVQIHALASAFDTVLAVYTGTGISSLREVASNHDTEHSVWDGLRSTPAKDAGPSVAAPVRNGTSAAIGDEAEPVLDKERRVCKVVAELARTRGEGAVVEIAGVLTQELMWVSENESHIGRGSRVLQALDLIRDSRAADMAEEYAEQQQCFLAGDTHVRRRQVAAIVKARRVADGAR